MRGELENWAFFLDFWGLHLGFMEDQGSDRIIHLGKHLIHVSHLGSVPCASCSAQGPSTTEAEASEVANLGHPGRDLLAEGFPILLETVYILSAHPAQRGPALVLDPDFSCPGWALFGVT